LRKEKNTLFEERSDEFVFFPKREDKQKQSKADIQRQRGIVLRYSLLDALLVIVGPTGVGKTEIAVNLVQVIKGEIISVDSRQVYKQMNIGTAKPSADLLMETPHHLIDIVFPDEVFNVADFKSRAEAIIQRLQTQDKLPILVGGSGLYIKAVIDGLFVGPGTDWSLRERLKEREKTEGEGALYRELEQIDQVTASRLHPRDQRRIIRALEVYYLSGRTISSYQKQSPRPLAKTVIIGLKRERQSLYRSIELRVDEMVKKGLIEEVKSLLAKGYTQDLPSMQGLGYRQVVGYFKGRCSKEEAIRLIKRDTRRFAKRQLNWFRRDNRIIWLDTDRFSSLSEISDQIIRILIQRIPEAKITLQANERQKL
jgi:tRNA dimethylallyltransferase